MPYTDKPDIVMGFALQVNSKHQASMVQYNSRYSDVGHKPLCGSLAGLLETTKSDRLDFITSLETTAGGRDQNAVAFAGKLVGSPCCVSVICNQLHLSCRSKIAR